MWGGRFSARPDQVMEAINASIDVDKRLAEQDIAGSKAHAAMLAITGVITAADEAAIQKGLDQVLSEIREGKLQFSKALEDIHMNVESRLGELIGPAAGRLHTARSRNDQVATDFRLYLREQSYSIEAELKALALAFVEQAEKLVDCPSPGFTHLQHAQPVSFGHELAKHSQALLRDISRLQDWRARHNYSPMGAGALAGSSLPLDPQGVARELGFTDALANSIDAVSARDFVSEFLFMCAQVGINLSRIGEEVILMASREFAWAKLDDAYSTGSSIMPQKKNPDIAELSRGKAGRLIGDLAGFMATAKSLPFGYNRDLQEDKEPVFDAVETLLLLLPAVTGMVRTLTFDTDRMASSAPTGFALATDIAEWLVRNRVPFRVAHEIAGHCVAVAEDRGVELWDLTDDELAGISEHLNPSVREVLTTQGSMDARSAFGGTAPIRVREQLASLRQSLQG